jgi:phosphatidate cytidylyltransferase
VDLTMLDSAPSPFSFGILALITVALVVGLVRRKGWRASPSLRALWGFVILLCIADWLSFRLSIWLFGFYCFLALREYLSLVNLRIQDRLGILGAYLSIPFMIYFVYIHWYGMFIISIPVFAFLLVPLLVASGGGAARGAVFSIGAIDLGLFLFVYCMGHIGYLAFFSVRMTMMFLLSVALSDQIGRLLSQRNAGVVYVVSAATTATFTLLISPWTTIPWGHSAILGAMIPLLVMSGNLTLRVLEKDLGVESERLESGRGLIFDSLKAYLFSAPPVFHYLRWFLDWGRV